MVDSLPPKPDKDKETKDKVSWTPAQEATLVAVLLDQMKQGNQAESGWKSVVWTVLVSSLQMEHPSSVPKQAQHCKSRWQRLKSEYKQVKELREQSGFGWDDTRQIVTAQPEVWQSYIQAHPKLGKWRTKSFPLFDDIATIAGDVVATGQHVFRAKSSKPDSPETSDNDEDENDSPFPNVSVDDIPTRTPRKRTSSTMEPRTTTTRKRPMRISGADAMLSVSGAMESIAAALSVAEPSSGQPELDPSPLRRAKAFQTAEAEEGFSENEMASVGILFEKSTPAADMYMAISNKKTRQIWLRKRLEN